ECDGGRRVKSRRRGGDRWVRQVAERRQGHSARRDQDEAMTNKKFFSVQPLRSLCLCGDLCTQPFTTETQRTQRLHREEFHCFLLLSPRTVTLTPFCNLSNPSTATTSPAFNPSTAVTFPSVVPVVTVCIATV